MISVSRARRASIGGWKNDQHREVLLTEEGGDLLLQAHTRDSMAPCLNQRTSQSKAGHPSVVDLVVSAWNWRWLKGAGEDGGFTTFTTTDMTSAKVGRLGAQGLLVDDAVHLLDGLGVSGGLTVTH
ncbi:hypothetical protein GWK47_012774 [Chionoecetes opilio]|uniref:Uncharacterized protein n=1 Tax=Chionoecetes opilio TaxID=41210 RepID=A0A8J5CL77_CHIOP|nr:hypothetical protein GWK47_012774 [Chionoecetes opilio]